MGLIPDFVFDFVSDTVMSYNPFVSLQWMLDGRTVSATSTRSADEIPFREDARRPTHGEAPGSCSTRTSASRSRSASSPIWRC